MVLILLPHHTRWSDLLVELIEGALTLMVFSCIQALRIGNIALVIESRRYKVVLEGSMLDRRRGKVEASTEAARAAVSLGGLAVLGKQVLLAAEVLHRRIDSGRRLRNCGLGVNEVFGVISGGCRSSSKMMGHEL